MAGPFEDTEVAPRSWFPTTLPYDESLKAFSY
jgi:hypothetical protein